MENPAEPTNADLYVAIETQNEKFLEHSFQDEEVARKQAIVNTDVKDSLDSLHKWKETVATKDDIKELKEFMKQVNIGVGIFRFSWNNAGKIGAFLLLIGGLFFFFKAGITAWIAWVATNNPVR